tara:strand:- start:33 stop:797 length:765 start_codon:yes stop_codon:yes gene_type:complete
MSFSSWDDGSWVRVLKNEDEDDLLDENIRRDVEQQVDDGVSEAERRLAEENEENAEFAEKRTKRREASLGNLSSTFGPIIERDEGNTKETSGKKKKRTDQEILDEYDKYDTGDSPDLKRRRLEGKPDISNPRLRDREGYGEVTNLQQKIQGAKDKVVSGAKKVKDVAGEAIQPVIQSAVNYKPPSSSAYPEAQAVIAAKVNMMLTEAQQNMMEGKPINNKAKIAEWVDVLQSSTTDPEQKRMGEQWKKILEASS